MSRCFPYHPPGYSLNKASNNTALIDSIKLQKEREITKAEKKKEKKREKKEKKRVKKEKAKHNTSVIAHDEKAREGEKSWSDFKGEYNQKSKNEKARLSDFKREYNKKSKNEAEQLERSDLTEEHGRPVSSENPSHSSDSTQNSNKRKRHASPPNSSYGHGNVIRIRLASQKRKDPDDSASKEVLTSISGRTNLPALQKCEIAPRATQECFCSTSLQTDICTQVVSRRPEKEVTPSGRSEIVAQDNKQCTSGFQRVELLYQDLIKNWIPSVLQNQQPDFDEEWLFGREDQQASHSGKRFKVSGDTDTSRCGPATMWPSVQYLPEADIYALPYAVPY